MRYDELSSRVEKMESRAGGIAAMAGWIVSGLLLVASVIGAIAVFFPRR